MITKKIEAFFKKPYIYTIIYGGILFVFSAFLLLDTFLIPHSYSTIDNSSVSEPSKNYSKISDDNVDIHTNEPSEKTKEPSNHIASSFSDNSYEDSNISIKITNIRCFETDIYFADITLKDPKYLKTALANDTFGRNITEKTSVIASRKDAILAINGDFYGARTYGCVMRNSKLLRDSSGDSSSESLIIDKNGKFKIQDESSFSGSSLIKNQVLQVLSFGPGLILDGNITVTENSEVGKAMASNPRTSIGYFGPNHYCFIVSDGRTKESKGLSLYQLASFLKDQGVYCAYNLDGGGSSTMYFNGKVINKPTADGRKFTERNVSDIVYIGY